VDSIISSLITFFLFFIKEYLYTLLKILLIVNYNYYKVNINIKVFTSFRRLYYAALINLILFNNFTSELFGLYTVYNSFFVYTFI
jgi:hypothetical protein